ncbi:SurA N-terminal domain-containing protein [Alteromonas sp. CYL-A6]|uniref:SurA N-terminal domain-containing protein n=1 Tax=Alteromonas nitratireducens TaxID=3390813 RepID=UPI0034BD2B0D
MLERIREGSQGPWAMAIIGLIVLSFVFAGVGSYLTSSGSTAVAQVNGEEISAQELERAYQNERARMESQYGESIATLFSSEAYMQDFRRNVLERLIADKLLLQKAEEMGLRASNQQIREALVSMPQFQYNGQFDNERFQAVLRQNGYQAADFRSLMRTQMTRGQLSAALGNSEFALPSEVERANALQRQTRDARYITIPSAPFIETVEVSDDEVQAYYDANLNAFDTEEKVKVAYVLLDAESLKADVSVADEDVETYYNNNINAYRTDEERRVSHILIEAGDDADAAKAKAESLLAQINDGADFAALAEAESDDLFSAENGGDLDFITPEMMDPAFDEAAFALASVGDVSEVVETEFGFHIIKLTDIKPEQVTAFEDVKEEIRDTLLSEKALDKFYEMQNTMAELAFEMPDTLEDVAAAIGVQVQTTPLFSRAEAPAPFDNPGALDVAFSDELVIDGVNSDVIDLGNDTVAVMRVAEHEPQRTQSLDEVKASIVSRLKSQKAQDAALTWAEELAAQIANGEVVDSLLEQRELAWQTAESVSRNASQLPRSIVDTLFVLSDNEGQRVDVTKTVNGDVALVELQSVHAAPALTDDEKAQLTQQLAAMTGQQSYQDFIEGLRAQADITITMP